MVGAGAIVFAVMGYVIANFELDRAVGAQVRLNPVILGAILGENPKDIQKAINYLCSPDPLSTSAEQSGKRLIKLGQFDYRVVNGAKYHAIRNAEERREQNRTNQAAKRARDKGPAPSQNLAGEDAYGRNVEQFGQEEADRIQDTKDAINEGPL